MNAIRLERLHFKIVKAFDDIVENLIKHFYKKNNLKAPDTH